MKTFWLFVGLFLLSPILPPQRDESGPKDIIHGIVIDQGGKPVKGLWLSRWVSGSAHVYPKQERTMLANIAQSEFLFPPPRILWAFG
jgi:hypothetical protein